MDTNSNRDLFERNCKYCRDGFIVVLIKGNYIKTICPICEGTGFLRVPVTFVSEREVE